VQIAILICLESSFWYSRHNFDFLSAFAQAWTTFAHSDAKKRMEQDISTSIAPRALNPIPTKEEQAILLDIILRNRLSKLSIS
jgi:hypothetical protein